jgi:two-component system chemotaxis response regulator CheB
MAHRDVIVVGASAGGVTALRQVLGELPRDLPAAAFVVLHMSPDSPGLLAQVLARQSALPIHEAVDGEPIRKGHVYVAVPDRHLMVDTERVRVVRGPKQNRARPALDPLFRAAAVAFGPRVVGVVLTGNLDDGTAGLRAIKERGGLAIVQDPRDAEFPGMPQSAVNHVEVDHTVPLGAIAATIAGAVAQPLDAPLPAPRPDLAVELRSDSGEGRMEDVESIGTSSVFSCPECRGTLWEVGETDLPRFRCRVGHAYSAENLVAEQSDAAEDTLWAALRALEENATLARRMARRFAAAPGGRSLAARYEHKAARHERHSRDLRRLLTETVPDEKAPQEEPQAT